MEGAYKVFKQTPVGQTRSADLFFRVFTIEPAAILLHSHDNEHMNYIIGGSGHLVVQVNTTA